LIKVMVAWLDRLNSVKHDFIFVFLLSNMANMASVNY